MLAYSQLQAIFLEAAQLMTIEKYIRMIAYSSIFLLAGFWATAVWVGPLTEAVTEPSKLSSAQADDFATAFNDDMPTWGAFKLARIAQQQPNVVFIGSSRGNSLRREMFVPYRF